MHLHAVLPRSGRQTQIRQYVNGFVHETGCSITDRKGFGGSSMHQSQSALSCIRASEFYLLKPRSFSFLGNSSCGLIKRTTYTHTHIYIHICTVYILSEISFDITTIIRTNWYSYLAESNGTGYGVFTKTTTQNNLW
jgi:hypothetical protein